MFLLSYKLFNGQVSNYIRHLLKYKNEGRLQRLSGK